MSNTVSETALINSSVFGDLSSVWWWEMSFYRSVTLINIKGLSWYLEFNTVSETALINSKVFSQNNFMSKSCCLRPGLHWCVFTWKRLLFYAFSPPVYTTRMCTENASFWTRFQTGYVRKRVDSKRIRLDGPLGHVFISPFKGIPEKNICIWLNTLVFLRQ